MSRLIDICALVLPSHPRRVGVGVNSSFEDVASYLTDGIKGHIALVLAFSEPMASNLTSHSLKRPRELLVFQALLLGD